MKNSKKTEVIEKETRVPISMLIYGRAGSGKSIFASTFPKPLIIDADGGHRIYEDKKLFPDAIYVRGDQVFPALQRAIEQIKAGTNVFETLIIDSLTNLENMAITAFKGMNSKNWAEGLYSARGKKLGYDEWGSISGSTIAILTELRRYNVNVVLITQLATTHDGGEEKYMPELTGKGQNESLHFPDVVAYMEAVEDSEGKQRLLHISSVTNDKFVAKSRLGVSEVKPIKNPSYKKLIKIIEETKPDLNFND